MVVACVMEGSGRAKTWGPGVREPGVGSGPGWQSLGYQEAGPRLGIGGPSCGCGWALREARGQDRTLRSLPRTQAEVKGVLRAGEEKEGPGGGWGGWRTGYHQRVGPVSSAIHHPWCLNTAPTPPTPVPHPPSIGSSQGWGFLILDPHWRGHPSKEGDLLGLWGWVVGAEPVEVGGAWAGQGRDKWSRTLAPQ